MGSRFETKIKPMLKYVGGIGAMLMGVAYLAIVFILVFGFTAEATLAQSVTFAAVNAFMGLIIMQFLKIQGIDLAKDTEENKQVLKEYSGTKARTKQLKSIKQFWLTSIATDIVVKGLMFMATTMGIIYIVIEGTQNYTWILLAIVNLFMFGCFGLLSLVRAYDFFNEEHIPYLKEKINEINKKQYQEDFSTAMAEAKEREAIIEREVLRRLGVGAPQYYQQRNDINYSYGGNTLLESSVDYNAISVNTQPVVLDNNNNNNPILGGSIYTSGNTADCINNTAKENI